MKRAVTEVVDRSLVERFGERPHAWQQVANGPRPVAVERVVQAFTGHEVADEIRFPILEARGSESDDAGMSGEAIDESDEIGGDLVVDLGGQMRTQGFDRNEPVSVGILRAKDGACRANWKRLSGRSSSG